MDDGQEAQCAKNHELWEEQDTQLRSHTPPRLDDGRRLIRIFAEYGCDLPLWESFTDHYVIERGVLPISSELEDALVAWNAEWDGSALEGDLPHRDRWLSEGRSLTNRLRTELHGIAEIRPEFED